MFVPLSPTLDDLLNVYRKANQIKYLAFCGDGSGTSHLQEFTIIEHKARGYVQSLLSAFSIELHGNFFSSLADF